MLRYHALFLPRKKFLKMRHFIKFRSPSTLFLTWREMPFWTHFFCGNSHPSINPDTLSAIAGEVADADSNANGPIFLRAKSATDKEPRFYETWVKNAGGFEFNEMMPGRYTIELYRDEDENGRFSPGKAFPFLPAERFYVYPDTIEIRSRWPNEGENIVIPE